MSTLASPTRPGRAEEPIGPHAWEGLRGWEILLVATVLIPAINVLLGDLTPARKGTVIVLLLAIPLAYLLIGRRAIRTDDGRLGRLGHVYVAILVLLFTPAALIEPSTTVALFGLCAQVFMALPSRRAVIAVIVLTLPEGVSLLVAGPGLDAAFNLVTLLTIVVFFSSAFGVWVERIIRQSRERAELIEELEASRAEVARLSAERGALAERERLAGEIHDTLAQGFTSIIMLIQAAEAQPDPARHLALAVQTARENLAEARALVAALSPAPLDESPLDEALRRVTARLGEELGLVTGFEVRGDSQPLPPQYDVVLIRAAQEGLNNVRKHADASRVDVTLEYGENAMTLHVRDDGRGFGPRPPSNGYGLRAMRARVEQAGGSVTVGGAEGQGAELVVRLPVGAR